MPLRYTAPLLPKPDRPSPPSALKLESTTMSRIGPAVEAALRPMLAWGSGNRLFLALLLGPPLAHRLHADYTTYLALGPGGLPHNALGWLASSLARALLCRETLSTAVYAGPGRGSFLARPLAPRRGPRPALGSHPIPHRQTDQIPPRDVISAVESAILEIHADYPSSTELCTSVYEKRGPALFVLPAAAEQASELAHVHASEEAADGSLHVVLAPRDCAEVIDKGWGERHPCAGVLGGRLLPAEYLMVYAPRDWAEVAVVRGIVEAAVRAALGVEGRADVPGGWK